MDTIVSAKSANTICELLSTFSGNGDQGKSKFNEILNDFLAREKSEIKETKMEVNDTSIPQEDCNPTPEEDLLPPLIPIPIPMKFLLRVSRMSNTMANTLISTQKNLIRFLERATPVCSEISDIIRKNNMVKIPVKLQSVLEVFNTIKALSEKVDEINNKLERITAGTDDIIVTNSTKIDELVTNFPPISLTKVGEKEFIRRPKTLSDWKKLQAKVNVEIDKLEQIGKNAVTIVKGKGKEPAGCYPQYTILGSAEQAFVETFNVANFTSSQLSSGGSVMLGGSSESSVPGGGSSESVMPGGSSLSPYEESCIKQVKALHRLQAIQYLRSIPVEQRLTYFNSLKGSQAKAMNDYYNHRMSNFTEEPESRSKLFSFSVIEDISYPNFCTLEIAEKELSCFLRDVTDLNETVKDLDFYLNTKLNSAKAQIPAARVKQADEELAEERQDDFYDKISTFLGGKSDTEVTAGMAAISSLIDIISGKVEVKPS